VIIDLKVAMLLTSGAFQVQGHYVLTIWWAHLGFLRFNHPFLASVRVAEDLDHPSTKRRAIHFQP